MGLKWRPEIHVHDIVDKIVKKKTITEVSSSRPQCSETWSTVIKGQFTLLTWLEVFTFISTRTKKFFDLGLTWSPPCSAKLNLYTDITRAWETSGKKEIVVHWFASNKDLYIPGRERLRVQDLTCSSIDTPESFIALLNSPKKIALLSLLKELKPSSSRTIIEPLTL